MSARHNRLRKIVTARDSYRCRCTGCGRCDGNCTRPGTTADHILPRIEGGLDVLDNYRAMCPSCNSSLGAALGNRRRHVHPFFLSDPSKPRPIEPLSPPVGPTPLFVVTPPTRGHDRPVEDIDL